MIRVQGIPRYRTDELERMPTLAKGHEDDLKVDDGKLRIWLSRCGIADGEPFKHAVKVETLDRHGNWNLLYCYDGDHPMTVIQP